ncbi:MAG: hypothetical protein IPM56_10920 [Ignavibacteriales bacterium]|nr:MAG: hypothetical protein IPM56_10920 [Ignavibacteriales bacterium]
MKVKLTSIKVNLIALLRKIEKLECLDEVNCALSQRVDEINKRLGDVEKLIEEIEKNV